MPKDLSPQELRLAVVMTGGVSLAIWMGGVASEIDQLIRARDANHPTPEQKVYADLLELSNYEPRVDVVSGTSAGGINGAILAGAVARRKTLAGLRDIWLDVADFGELLRSPFEKDQPSLLMGDQYFTPGLQKGLDDLLGAEQLTWHEDLPPVDLLVTTTLLNGEDSGLVDSYGTRIPDVHHNALFKFDRKQLMEDSELVTRLALTARSSASFPVAFEPSWVPCDPNDADDDHPSMKGIADFHANHFVIDGGVLVNRPIEPALRSMFEMKADDEDVCRVLLYVVPDPGETLKTEPEKQDAPFDLTDVGMKSLVAIPRTQSIARELERLKEHDARVTQQRDARDFVLEHCFESQLGRVNRMLTRYRERRAEREVEWLLGELTLRYRTTMERELGFDPIRRGDLVRDLTRLRERTLPRVMPQPKPWPWQIAPWGIDSLERAATVTLDLARRGVRRADEGAAHDALVDARRRVHAALAQLRDRRAARRGALRDKHEGEALEAWTAEMLRLMRKDDAEVVATALVIAAALRDAANAIRDLPDAEDLKALGSALAPDADARDGECLRRLFALEVIQEALGVTSPVVEQPIKLLQVSANTRDGISSLKTAAEKLTGMRLIHFAAFYKPSWRANDWMWGRLDAAGWLTQLVLEPSRLKAVFADEVAHDRIDKAMERIRTIAVGQDGADQAWLERQFEQDAPAMKAELAWLKDDDPKVPPALPICSMVVARRIQLAMLAKELPAIAKAVRLDEARQALSQSGRNFRAVWHDAGGDATPEQRRDGLRACHFAAEGFTAEYDSGLLARSASGAAATAASVLAGARSGMPDLVTKSRITASARGLTLAVHGLVDAALRESPMAFALIVVLTAVAGALLGIAFIADGAQPGLIGLGFTIALAAWFVALWRTPTGTSTREPDRWRRLRQFLRHLGWTAGVILRAAAIALIPWMLGLLLPACPERDGKPTDCWQGDVESFIDGLEPAFIVFALVWAAAAFGRRAARPRAPQPAE